MFTHTQGVIGWFIPESTPFITGSRCDSSLESNLRFTLSSLPIAGGGNYLNPQPAPKMNIPFYLFICVDIRHKTKKCRGLRHIHVALVAFISPIVIRLCRSVVGFPPSVTYLCLYHLHQLKSRILMTAVT